ncbi:MAG: hypothetical protein FD161_463 [Limisphaerales bacterium]|nr:MAG: hypothetical protein FD161_463 [Limisphaerales bacterium]KAG0510368.1 MAG: hypothetical protein E1N63_463 [Limisphaerales bacterium]TXT51555.1 MAG: hypothetical protein FD140_1593 [Limisphaerales bacterium]
MNRRAMLSLLLAAPALPARAAGVSYVASKEVPPAVPREFRGAWVATVGNIDWPSKAGLTTQQQQAELLALLDKAVALRLNAIVLQVRPGCDALYASKLEPWSEYLTGTMGRAPEPYYDPLAFAVAEAHRRGLELHAWFNPFRARHAAAKSPVASSHISKTRPELVRKYGALLWLDPGEQLVHEHSLRVILDVTRRYDVDGVHLDDYFYPYPEKTAAKQVIPFPDDASWRKYQKSDGKLARDDWRRDNVNRFVQRLYSSVKAEKPWVKVGISPFGIWKPGHPPGVRGMDATQEIYADALRWFRAGWVDYLAPQLYWSIDAPEQSFPALLKWWAGQNAAARHLWPGLSAAAIAPDGRRAEEIIKQLQLIRAQPGATGSLQWSIKPLHQNRDGLADKLVRQVFQSLALIPASPWLDKFVPAKPIVAFGQDAAATTSVFRWELPGGSAPGWWLVQMRFAGQWRTELVAGGQFTRTMSGGSAALPEVIAVTAVSRFGQAGPAFVAQRAG